MVVNLPDKVGREAILKVHTRKVPLAKDASLMEVAAATPGLSGADLRNLVNEAALLAARRDQNEVRQKDFLDALEKLVLGPERPLLLTREDRERIAVHESGHAILGLVVAGADPVNRVTIVPRGQALGVTYQRPDSDRYNFPEAYLRARIVGMLGGRAAEELVYGTRTTGAENDIQQVTELARSMVTRWGMSEKLGMVQLAPKQNPFLLAPAFPSERAFSEETARTIDTEVARIIAESHAEARRLLERAPQAARRAGRGAARARDSRRARDPAGDRPAAGAAARDPASGRDPVIERVLEQQRRDLGGFEVGRVLPQASRRMVGPFVFFDHMGPVDFPAGIPRSVDVRPHPHIGLSTLTYLFEGEIMHRDSVGSEQAIRPGEVNWMTAGRGVTHSERFERARREGGRMNGIQAWLALPREYEEIEPGFSHHGADCCRAQEEPGLVATAGGGRSVRGALSGADALTPLLRALAVRARRARSAAR